jgi:AcrR family transcriptional regulator
MPRVLTPADIADFRNRLCDVTAQLFAELGHDGFNMRELAKRLGVSAMTPYRYFEDKGAILSEVRARTFALFADWLEEALAVNGADLAALTNAYAQFAIQEQTKYRLMFNLTQPQTPVSAALTEQERRVRAAVTGHARNLVERGILSGDPEILGMILWSTLHGVTALYLTGKLSSDDFHRVLSASVCLSVDGEAGAVETPASDRSDLGAEPWRFTRPAFQPIAGE